MASLHLPQHYRLFLKLCLVSSAWFLHPFSTLIIRWMTSAHSASEPSGWQNFRGSCLVLLFRLQPRWESTSPSEMPAQDHLNTSSEHGFSTCSIFVTTIFQSRMGVHRSSMIMSPCTSRSYIGNQVSLLRARANSPVRSHYLPSRFRIIAPRARQRVRFRTRAIAAGGIQRAVG